MLIAIDSTKSLATVCDDLPRACAGHKFGVLGVHDLKAKMREKGVEYEKECFVFEVCNPHKAKQVLDSNPEIATALPCRIAVFERPEGGARLATIKPTALIGLFGSPELQEVAAEVERTLGAILEEASR